MKRLALLLALAACHDVTAPQPSSIRFTLSPDCPSTALAYLIDDTVVGRGTLAPGQSSENFPVRDGDHTASAIRSTDPTSAAHVWAGPLQFVAQNQRYSLVLACG